MPGRHRRPSRTPRLLALAGVVAVLGVGVGLVRADVLSWPGAALAPGDPAPSGDAARATESASVPDGPTGWEPTRGELAAARTLVASWSTERLAGQVIVGRYHGTDPEEVRRLVTDLHLAGVSVTTGNVEDTDQVVATARAAQEAVLADGRDFPPVLGVDQEGGHVSHLRGVATEFPSFSAAGRALAADRDRGRALVRRAARTTGEELRSLGFTWVFAPVADVTVGTADAAIGSRSPSHDPDLATDAVRAAVRGYSDAALVSTTKHFPGHGSATTDSHDALPQLDRTRTELERSDLRPFTAAVRAGAPAVMVAHLSVPDLGTDLPTSLAPEAYAWLRATGFEGVAVTDSLGMGALGGVDRPAVRALAAGADLLLMPVDTRVTHSMVVRAVESGDVPRARIEEAAARVVAVQRWQARVAQRRALPPDVTTAAREAAAELDAH